SLRRTSATRIIFVRKQFYALSVVVLVTKLRAQPFRGKNMIIGSFTYDPASDTYSGEIRTLTLQRHLVLRPTVKRGEREPDYPIVADGDGTPIEFGAAWKRQSERGQDFLSIVLDDPALRGPMNAALFIRDRDNSSNLVWTRPAPRPKSVEPERPEGSS